MKDKIIEIAGGSDLRVQKTYKALYRAMYTLLERRNFSNITVHDLCSEAFVSRATFYAHFRDKYDLLEYLLLEIRDGLVKDVHKYDELEKSINQFMFSNKKLVSNVLKDANSETLMLIREFMSSIVELMTKRKVDNETSPHHIMFYNFCTGGLVNLLTWIVENNFPPQITMMNPYLYKMLEAITNWDAEQE